MFLLYGTLLFDLGCLLRWKSVWYASLKKFKESISNSSKLLLPAVTVLKEYPYHRKRKHESVKVLSYWQFFLYLFCDVFWRKFFSFIFNFISKFYILYIVKSIIYFWFKNYNYFFNVYNYFYYKLNFSLYLFLKMEYW